MRHSIPCSSKRPSRSRGGTILGIFVGMILGAIIVTAAVWFFNRNDNPFSQPSQAKQAAGPTAPQPGTAQQAAATPSDPAALPGKPGDRPVEKQPGYTFFNTLPNGESAPVAQPAGQAQPTAAPRAQPAPTKQMYLQLAAFENAEMADDLKARLLLMGLDPVTQRTQSNDGRVMHRIRVGPFTDRDDLKAMRDRLVSNGLSAEEVSN